MLVKGVPGHSILNYRIIIADRIVESIKTAVHIYIHIQMPLFQFILNNNV